MKSIEIELNKKQVRHLLLMIESSVQELRAVEKSTMIVEETLSERIDELWTLHSILENKEKGEEIKK